MTETAWANKLLTEGGKDLKFNVIYYRTKDTAAGKGVPREINMIDYYKAMYVVDNANQAKATWPIPTGAPTGSVTTVLGSVLDEYEYSLRLYYYNPQIDGRPGEGKVNLSTTDYINPNAAILPITEQGLIYTYKGLKVVRRDATEGADKDFWPKIASNGGAGSNNTTSLYNSIKLYWTPEWEYQSTDGSKTTTFPTTWPAYSSTAGASGNIEFDDEPVEEGGEVLRTDGVFYIAGPDSNTNEIDEWNFSYWMLP